jgi:hypothetical protein
MFFRISVLGSNRTDEPQKILWSLCDAALDTDYVPTLFDGFEKDILIEAKPHRPVFLKKAGQTKPLNIVLKSSNTFVIVSSITSRVSFHEIKKFSKRIHELANPGYSICLTGNHCGMQKERAVKPEEGKSQAQQLGWLFFECSSKKNINISRIFETVLETLAKSDSSNHGREGTDDGGGSGCCQRPRNNVHESL